MPEVILLVDYENVKDAGLKQLPPHQRVMLFIGKQQKPKLDFIQRTLTGTARLDMIPLAEQGRNNLDFYIAFYLGKTASEEPNAQFIVFSDDKDLDPLLEHLRRRGIFCERKGPSLSVRTAKSATIPKPKAGSSKPQEKAAAPKQGDAPTEATAFLKRAAGSRPKRISVLVKHLETRLKKKPAEIEQIIENLVRKGLISISEAGNVTYKL